MPRKHLDLYLGIATFEALYAPAMRYVDEFALFHDDPSVLDTWRARLETWLEGRRLRLHSAKSGVFSTCAPSQFLGYVLAPHGQRRLPEDNVRRFRNRPRGLRDRWRAGVCSQADVQLRVQSRVAHAKHANTWRLRHAVFRGGWFDPAWSDGTPVVEA